MAEKSAMSISSSGANMIDAARLALLILWL
jgi:hypothetical protein